MKTIAIYTSVTLAAVVLRFRFSSLIKGSEDEVVGAGAAILLADGLKPLSSMALGSKMFLAKSAVHFFWTLLV